VENYKKAIVFLQQAAKDGFSVPQPNIKSFLQ